MSRDAKILPIVQRMLISLVLLSAASSATAAEQAGNMELSRPAHPWEFLCAVGTRAALLGNESGRVEAWVYPLKLFRDFHLRFHLQQRMLDAEALARQVSVRPESTTITYAFDTFQVKETFFVPVNQPGAVIRLDVRTTEPLDIEAVFRPDFTLEWPASLGGTYSSWNPELRAFSMGEESKKYAALIGSATAAVSRENYFTNFSSSSTSGFRLGTIDRGNATKIIVLAASLAGAADAEKNYRNLLANHALLLHEAQNYYRTYLDNTVTVSLPDNRLQQAYDWARISVLQGVVNNPMLGTGLVAGYRTSGETQRPGFAWFFGRDAEWTSLALDADGDFQHARQALEFIMRYQRADGRVPHEISQTATLVDWFKNYPYGWASADATPLLIAAARDYVRRSGDTEFIRAHWDNLWRAYQFLRSTWDAHGFARNMGVGHGWIEGGPLRPAEQGAPAQQPAGLPASQVIKTELYQTAAGVQALRALAEMARIAGRDTAASELEIAARQQASAMNQMFWNASTHTYAFALDPQERRIDVPSVLATVPMWFGLLDGAKADAMIDRLADSDFTTDWGMRIISSRDSRYDPGGYHYGSVWPLFTGWASVGEYRYHRPAAALANLRANSELALDGSPGHVTEVLSGDYNQELSTSSPHQIWSAAMVVSPLLLGMLGLDVNAPARLVTLAPHVPATWNSFTISHLRVGSDVLQFTYSRTAEDVRLRVDRTGPDAIRLQFAPGFSPMAHVGSMTWNGSPATFHMQNNSADQHAVVDLPLANGTNELRVAVGDDFGFEVPTSPPALGDSSQQLKPVSQSWSKDHGTLELTFAGLQGRDYDVVLVNAGSLRAVEGATLTRSQSGGGFIKVHFGGGGGEYQHARVVLRFATAAVKLGQ